jgi:hypothetical protein
MLQVEALTMKTEIRICQEWMEAKGCAIAQKVSGRLPIMLAQVQAQGHVGFLVDKVALG